MTLDPNFELADVSKDGTIFMGKTVTCDGYNFNRKNAVYTHIHGDHIGRTFNKALQNVPGQIYSTYQTLKLLEALNGESYERRRQFHKIDPTDPKMLVKGEEIPYEILDSNDSTMVGDQNYKEKLTLLESSHMLGACSVRLATPDGPTIGYSGDFTSEDEPPKCDILIIDATHGTPQFNKKNTDLKSLERRLLEFVEREINNGKPVVIHASRGKLQELMSVVSSSTEIANTTHFYSSKEDIDIAKIYDNHPAFDIRDILQDNDEAGTAYRNSVNPFVEFSAGPSKKRYEESGKAFGIHVMGYLGEFSCIERESSTYFQMSNHATFENIIKYIEKSEATKIIVEGTRTKLGAKLTSHLTDLDFDAVCKPEPVF
jgi:predicted metal-dependent RNase